MRTDLAKCVAVGSRWFAVQWQRRRLLALEAGLRALHAIGARETAPPEQEVAPGVREAVTDRV